MTNQQEHQTSIALNAGQNCFKVFIFKVTTLTPENQFGLLFGSVRRKIPHILGIKATTILHNSVMLNDRKERNPVDELNMPNILMFIIFYLIPVVAVGLLIYAICLGIGIRRDFKTYEDDHARFLLVEELGEQNSSLLANHDGCLTSEQEQIIEMEVRINTLEAEVKRLADKK